MAKAPAKKPAAKKRTAAELEKELAAAQIELATLKADPIALIECAVLARTHDRYRRNAALAAFTRHYEVDQVEIKAHQERLDMREKNRIEAAQREARSQKARRG